ncbi:MAG: acetyl-CoA carboxylase biotin carboxyl carrier protein [Planctomycetota bacterium]
MLASDGQGLGNALIDIRKLKELVKLMVENDLSELDLRDEAETVVVRRSTNVVAAPQVQLGTAPVPVAAPAPDAPAALPPAEEDESLHAIVCPMVGTFYSAPDPESPAYAKKGTEVDPDSVVCIVEAMKVFSEIKAECTGTVEKVLVKNGDPVEYGQKLFLVRTK